MPVLDTIDTQYSNMTGPLPDSLPADVPNLRIFQLNYNNLTGDRPGCAPCLHGLAPVAADLSVAAAWPTLASSALSNPDPSAWY